MDVSSDNQIMLQVKSGDIDKLGILFERYKIQLFSYFFRTTGNKSTSEDLVQTVFFRILKYREKFSGYGKFTSWMYHIAFNAKVDHFRKNKRFQYSEDISQIEMESSQQTDSPVLKKEEKHLLEKALNRLNDKQKEVLVLSKYQGLKYKEIANIMDCSEGNVKVKVFRALTELKKIYTKLDELYHG